MNPVCLDANARVRFVNADMRMNRDLRKRIGQCGVVTKVFNGYCVVRFDVIPEHPYWSSRQGREWTIRADRLELEELSQWPTHQLYTDDDKDRPDVICDRNGQVVLGLCKRCGRGEAQLEESCQDPAQTHEVPRG